MFEIKQLRFCFIKKYCLKEMQYEITALWDQIMITIELEINHTHNDLLLSQSFKIFSNEKSRYNVGHGIDKCTKF